MRRKWQPSPVLLPGKSPGQRSPAGCSPWGHRLSDVTEHARRDPGGIMLSERCQTEKEKYCVISLYVESKKTKRMNRAKQEQSHREQMGGYWRVGSKGDERNR